MTVSSVLREATAAAIEDALRNCGAYTGTAYEDGSFCFDGDIDPKDLADAAIAALDLTPETALYAKYPDEPAPHSRLVSPWVASEGVGPVNSLGVPSGRELLATIPEGLRDKPFGDLAGLTPRQAAEHVDEFECLACRGFLRQLGAAA